MLASDTQDRLEHVSRSLDGLAGAASAVSASGNGSIERWAVQFRRLRENFRAIQSELDLIRQGREQLKVLNDAIHQLEAGQVIRQVVTF